VGLVARVLEERGIPTVLVSTGRDLTRLVRPPRALFVNAPMGNPFGRPGEKARQREILLDALRLAEADLVPGTLLDHRYDYGAEFRDRVEKTLAAMTFQQ
jgi:D-proline reductase (dithiol) PrdB